MKRGWLMILFAFFLIQACKQNQRIPGSVLPPQKMQDVLWDIMRADQFLTDYVLNKDSSKNKRTESIRLYQQIFAIHHISKENFQKSFLYYKSRPGLLSVLMDSISKKTPAIPAFLPSKIQDSSSHVRSPDSLIQRKRIKPLSTQ